MKHPSSKAATDLAKIAERRKKDHNLDKLLTSIEGIERDIEGAGLDLEKEPPIRRPYSSEPLIVGERWH